MAASLIILTTTTTTTILISTLITCLASTQRFAQHDQRPYVVYQEAEAR